MIDKVFKKYWPKTILYPNRLQPGSDKALTAIYEIGLECIGAAEVDHYSGTAIESLNTEEKAVRFRNELRASQRKAWAKACGVAEK